MYDLTYPQAIEKAEHLLALDQTRIYLRDDDGFPYSRVCRVEDGGSWRLNAPSSCYLIVEEGGLTFRLNVDFEPREANGRGVSMFDRERLRELMVKLSPVGREALATMLDEKVLPGLSKGSAELREAMSSQIDSEECVRGLVAFARAQ